MNGTSNVGNIEHFCPIHPSFFCLVAQHRLSRKGFGPQFFHALHEKRMRRIVDQIHR